MDLFVINRYNEENQTNVKDEQSKLDKVLSKIKKRKLARENKKQKENIKFNSRFKEKKLKTKNELIALEAENAKKLKIEGESDDKTEEEINRKESTNKKKSKKKLAKDDEKSKDDNETKTEEKSTKKNKVDKKEPSADESTNEQPLNIEEQDSDIDEPKTKKLKKVLPSDIEGFTILGVDKFGQKKTVKRILPKWLRNPTVISSDLKNLEKKLSRAHLNSALKRNLKEKKIKYLFPVQAEFIPWQLKVSKISGLIAPQDACISAPTGSGKTLAFTIPILQSLLQQIENRCLTIKTIRALIILPTQGLAFQIYDTLKSLTTESEINVGLATGAGNRSIETEQKQLITYNSVWGASSKVDILVCTAGRLVDHLKSTKGFDLKHLQYIIIDEADRVLDAIQDDWLYHLGIHLREDNESSVNRNIVNVESVKQRTDPQKLLFSATLSQDPEKLQKLSLFQPKLFTCVSDHDNTEPDADRFIGKYTTPSELIEKYIVCTIETKPLVLYKLIANEIDKSATCKILVFVNTDETLHRLNVLLKYMGKDMFSVAEISSSRGRLEARKTLIKKFEEGVIQVLVCTDSMARGIDIPNVDCVISYSVPNYLKTYIHRAGRTARAGSTGLCISMLHAKQQSNFLNMIKNIRSQSKTVDEIKVADKELEALGPLFEKSLVQLKEKVNDELQKSALKIKTKKLAFNKKKNKRNKKFHSVKVV